jgi:hypothetical protein
MEPEHFAFGGGATQTFLNPLVVVWMLLAIVLILTLPRQKVIVPFLLAFFTIPLAQVILVGGLHFPVLRILILAGLVRRAMFHGSSSSSAGKFPGGSNGLDRVVILWTISALIVPNLQWMNQQFLIKSLGDFLDALGGYLVVRFLIPDGEAIRRTVKVLAVICVIHGSCMVSEQYTHQNVFAVLGAHAPEIRDGHVRSEGILGTLFGGTFGGVLIPLFLWLWTTGESRMVACAGMVGAAAIALASHASTAWMACGAGLVGLAFWPLRKQMRLIRWGIVVLLVALHLVMHGPVWSLIEKIDLTGGSSSYHRYMLVDNCIRHFSDWWLLGFKHPGDWGFVMWDLCNQFVAVALSGGLISLIIYIAIFSRAFGALGDARKQVNGQPHREWLLWCLGAVLFGNLVASFGINYMVQLLLLLFPLLACISVASFEARQVSVEALVKPDAPFVPIGRPVGGALVGNARKAAKPRRVVSVKPLITKS